MSCIIDHDITLFTAHDAVFQLTWLTIGENDEHGHSVAMADENDCNASLLDDLFVLSEKVNLLSNFEHGFFRAKLGKLH